MAQDLSVFLGELIRKPGRVVALAPSSETLAREMADNLPLNPGPVIELGAGTGKITRALLDAGVAPEDLLAIELSPEFAQHLRRHFADVHVHQGRAEDLARVAPRNARAVVSGLPLLSMPNRVQAAILDAARKVLRHNGRFIQFTYGPTPPVAESLRREFGLTWSTSRRVWNNLPPARVYSFRFDTH